MKSLVESILSSTNSGRSSFEVDLGLSVNWCSCNVGAKRPQETGLYFAWGDTKGYNLSEINKNMFNVFWYDNLPASNIKGDLPLKDDAARKYMKGKWRMPTKKELNELIKNTKQIGDIVNGINGVRFISNRNSIFFPLTGIIRDGEIKNDGNVFDYWLSTEESSDSAFSIGGDISGHSYSYPLLKYLGLNIRAVCDK